jgi:hypothetical protein
VLLCYRQGRGREYDAYAPDGEEGRERTKACLPVFGWLVSVRCCRAVPPVVTPSLSDSARCESSLRQITAQREPNIKQYSHHQALTLHAPMHAPAGGPSGPGPVVLQGADLPATCASLLADLSAWRATHLRTVQNYTLDW